MRRRARGAAALVAAAGLAPAAAGASLVAERIGDASVAERRIGGPDAIGGVGDWYLANDRIEIVVDDPSRRFGTLSHGGTIVDAGLRGRDGDDQLARLWPLLNLDQRVLAASDRIRAEVEPGRAARLVVTGSRGPEAIPRGGALARRFHPLVPETREIEAVRMETVYEVRPGEPFVRISTTLRNTGERPAPLFSLGEVWMRGGRSMRSFVGNTLAPERSRGFHHSSFDRSAILAAGDAMAAFTFVAMAGLPPFPPVVYALFAPERAALGIPLFGVTGKHVTLANAFLSDEPWQELGVLRLLGATRHRLAPGAVWRYRRRLLVTGGRDVAAATDLAFPLLGFADGRSGIEGRVEPAELRVAIHVDAAGGGPITQIAPPARGPRAGRYRAVLPPGGYELTLRAAHHPPRRLRVTVAADGFAAVPLQRFDPPAQLVFGAPFADGGPGRVIVTGAGGTPDPVFAPELLDFRLDGAPAPSGLESREIHFLGNATDPRRVALPPGRYRLTATRGPEFDLAVREVELAGPGASVAVPPFELRRVVTLPEFVSADLHAHAQASDDSGMTNEARLRSHAAEGVDVMVTTDHDNLGWFEPALDALSLRGRLAVIQGVEVTSSAPSRAAPWTIGHHNAWPLRYRRHAHRGGAPPSQDVSVADLYAALRRDHGAEVVQLNHALPKRPGLDEGAYLSHLGSAGEPYDPSRPLEAWPNALLLAPGADGRTRALDFDVMEVMNGSSFPQYLELREVWYSLLRQGVRRTATGNSDSHGPDEPAAYPRNYVRVPRDPLDVADFDAALRAGRSFFSNGPLVVGLRANGGRMGDRVAAPDGRLEVEVAVSAAPWVPVDEVRLLVNGEVARRWRSLAAPDRIRRFARRATLRLAGDAFVTVEAGAALDIEPERWRAERGGVYSALVAPGAVAQALTNPIWVDVDGNGRFDPPGPAARHGPALRLSVTLAVIALLALVWWWLRRGQAARGARTT